MREKKSKPIIYGLLAGLLTLAIYSCAVGPEANVEKLERNGAAAVTASAFSDSEYSTALKYAVQFYDANKCGPDAAKDNSFSWRGACHTSDGSDVGVDLKGGFHDAGDHVKFNMPASTTASLLGWALLEYKDSFDKSGSTSKMLSILKYFTDYFLKCHPNSTTYYYQVGDGGADHGYWGPPENQTGSRPTKFKADMNTAASDVDAQTAAALTIMYLNYKSIDSTYADKCLQAAKELYVMAKNKLGLSPEESFYTTYSFYDDLSWAAIWLSTALNDTSYLASIKQWVAVPIGNNESKLQNIWGLCWDDVYEAVFIKMYQMTGDVYYKDAAEFNLNYWMGKITPSNNVLKTTPGGLRWLNNWGSLRYAASASFAAMIYYKQSGNSELKNFAIKQIDYALGKNPKNMSYLIGFGSNWPKQPHHRAANPNQGAAKYTLTGALVGGPDAGDNFNDSVSAYENTEVAIDYNSGLVGALAGLISGSVYSSSSAVSVSTSSASSVSTVYSSVSSVSSQASWPSGAVKVQTYQNGSAIQNQIYERIMLVNTGNSSIALSSVKIRYYLKYQGSQGYGFACDYSQAGSANITGAFAALNPAQTGADAYNEIAFTSGAGSLAAGASVELQCRIWKTDWSNIDNSQNYSYNPSTGYTDWGKVTVFVNNGLSWGVEPGDTASSASQNSTSSISSAVVSSIGSSLSSSSVSSYNNNTGAAYAYGLPGVYGDQGAYMQAQYAEWKSVYVTSSGAGGNLRVQRDSGTSFDTVSEGIGYGMILAVYFNDKTTFNGLYAYYKSHLNGNGFMHWQIDKNGSVIGQNGATDADEDVALALCFASKVWGSSGSVNYSSEATVLINKIMSYEVEGGSYILKPGDAFGGSSIYNPSYFAPAFYRVFKAHTGDSRWDNVIAAGYSVLTKIQQYNAGTGFSPDWCTAAGQNCGKSYDLGYDAIRVPFRIGLDWSWYGNSQARDINNKFLKFFDSKGSTNTLRDGYTITGNVTGLWWSPTFAAMIASASMSTNDLAVARKWYDSSKNKNDPYTNPYHYYGSCLRLMNLVYQTGLFQNLYDGIVSSSSSIKSSSSMSSIVSSKSSNPVSSVQSSSSSSSLIFSSSSVSSQIISGNIKLQTFQNGAAVQNQVYLKIKVVNTSSSAIALSTIKVRYYFLKQGSAAYSFACDWTSVGTGNVSGSFGTVSPAQAGADSYIEISFASGAGSLSAGTTIEIQARMWRNDWSNIDNSLNYSYNPSPSYIDWNKTIALQNGTVTWGIVPGGIITSSSQSSVSMSSVSSTSTSTGTSSSVFGGQLPCDPLATSKAKSLLNYLKTHTYISGQTDMADGNRVKNLTGRFPAIIAFDFYSFTDGDQAKNDRQIQEAIDFGKSNGIVSFQWHWKAPIPTGRGEYYTQWDFAAQLNNTTSQLYKDIDLIAAALKKINDAGIPVVFRPLHEANNNFMWWAKQGTENYKTLFRLMYNRITAAGAHSTLWVFNGMASGSSAATPMANWYPGNSYVDIISGDYTQSWNDLNVMKNMGNNKTVGISETFYALNPASDAGFSFSVVWASRDWADSKSGRTVADVENAWKNAMSNPKTISKDQLPDMSVW